MADNLRETYKTKVATESSNKSTKIKAYQSLFQANKGQPVYLKTRTDLKVYRGVMAFSVLGIGLAMFSIFRMATGRIQKKE